MKAAQSQKVVLIKESYARNRAMETKTFHQLVIAFFNIIRGRGAFLVWGMSTLTLLLVNQFD